jgi:hypothetical protein
MAGTGETVQTVWVLSQYEDADGRDTCEVIAVFGNAESALAAYLERTIDPEGSAKRTAARQAITDGEEVDFTAAEEGGELLLQRIPFVGPMSGGRRKRKTTRRRR